MRVVLWLFFGWVARFDILVFGWTKIQPRENGPKMLSILVLDIATSFFFFPQPTSTYLLLSCRCSFVCIYIYMWILNNVSNILKLKNKYTLHSNYYFLSYYIYQLRILKGFAISLKFFCQFKGK